MNIVNSDETVRLKDAALNHLWMHNRDWTEAAEEGGPLVVSTGHGIRVTDTDGKSWIDVNGGYSSVNVGFGRLEIAEAVNEQMHRITYFPQKRALPLSPGLVNCYSGASGAI